MRALLIAILGVFILTALSLSYAGAGTVADDVVEVAKENPGKTAGVAGCIAVIIAPPAWGWCALTLIGGAAIDGDLQPIFDKLTE